MKQVFMKKTMAFLLSSALVVTSVLVPATTSKAAVKPTSMTLNQGSKTTMYVGGSTTIKVKSVKPSKASKAVTFKSSNSKIVKVTSKGKVTALSAGKATVTVKSKANTKLSKKVKVTVKDLVKKTTDEQIVIPLTKKNYKLSLNTSASNLTFKSSKKTVASVSSKGVITPKKAGTAKITVTGKKGAVKGAKQVITVYVAKKAVKSVKLNATKKTINVGKSFTLKATVNPTGASNKVTFTSSNPKVVTVSNKGVVKGIKAGTAKITVTTLDGNKKASCTVTVVSPKPTATKAPTKVPTKAPTKVPTTKPTATVEPTATVTPTAEPTAEPTATVAPTAEPTATVAPTAEPTATVAPTAEPTATVAPTAEPTAEPTATVAPTAEPTAEPTATVAPTAEPTAEPTATVTPTAEPTATVAPTAEPTAEPTATVTPTAEPTATVAPTAEPTPAGVYTYTFDKSATSYEITKKGADYTIAIAREDLVKDINTVKEKLQAPITSEVIKNQWPKFTKENMVENSEILQANKSLLKNFDIAPADPGLVNKMVTITKDGKTSWAIIRPNEAFTEFDVETYKDGNRKNVSVKAEGLAECKADENGIVTLPVTVSGLKTGDIKLKVEYPTDLSYVKLYKTVGSKDKMVMWYKETTKDYTLYIDETYADEFCDAMGVGNVFETISVKNIYAD